jgi:hypothetical protein
MKKATPQMVGSDHKISRMDYYQILTSALMVILGAVILFRSFTVNMTIMPLLVGGGFLALGFYRLKFVIGYFREKRKWNHR